MITLTLAMMRRWFGRSRAAASDLNQPAGAGCELIFRLKAWPQLPEDGRTAEIYRMLSVMSSQPVNRQWLQARCRMAPQQLDRLLMQLKADGALEVIDPSLFARRTASAA
jgi:hypothetical protein